MNNNTIKRKYYPKGLYIRDKRGEEHKLLSVEETGYVTAERQYQWYQIRNIYIQPRRGRRRFNIKYWMTGGVSGRKLFDLIKCNQASTLFKLFKKSYKFPYNELVSIKMNVKGKLDKLAITRPKQSAAIPYNYNSNKAAVMATEVTSPMEIAREVIKIVSAGNDKTFKEENEARLKAIKLHLSRSEYVTKERRYTVDRYEGFQQEFRDTVLEKTRINSLANEVCKYLDRHVQDDEIQSLAIRKMIELSPVQTDKIIEKTERI